MLDRDWTVVREIWVNKYGEVTRATMMAAKRGGYNSYAALRAPSGAYIRIQRPGTICHGAQGGELGTQVRQGG